MCPIFCGVSSYHFIRFIYMHVITSIKIGAKYFFARITHTYLLKLYIHSINYSLTFINSNYFAAKLLLHATFWGEKCGRCLLWYYGIRWFCTYTDAARIHQHFVCIFFLCSDGTHKLCIIFFVFWVEVKKNAVRSKSENALIVRNFVGFTFMYETWWYALVFVIRSTRQKPLAYFWLQGLFAFYLLHYTDRRTRFHFHTDG